MPVGSPDGTSFYYVDNAASRIMKMSTEGGTPEAVKASAVASGFMMGAVNFSPDGKWIPEVELSSDPATQAVTQRIVLLNANPNPQNPAKYLDPLISSSRLIPF